MLEEKIDLLTKEVIALRKSLDANTAALGGKKSSAAADDEPKASSGKKPTASSGKKPAASSGSKFKAADIKTIAIRVKDEVSPAVAKKLIIATGAADLNDLITNNQDQWDDFHEAATAALPEDDTTAEDDDDGL